MLAPQGMEEDQDMSSWSEEEFQERCTYIVMDQEEQEEEEEETRRSRRTRRSRAKRGLRTETKRVSVSEPLWRRHKATAENKSAGAAPALQAAFTPPAGHR
uniref:Uncharacterized protein n=1 Tax=Knipowitschia caucasica TaxID=637954 RepID=A0AAV2KB73_KNICA